MVISGILHGVHWGLGHGIGELIGGFLVSWIGAKRTFIVFGFLSLADLLIFATFNVTKSKCCRPKDEEEERSDKAEEPI